MGRLYKAYILPHLEYCCPLLLGAGSSQKRRLEDTNNYFLRSILGHGKQTPCDLLLNTVAIGLGTLEQRTFQALVLVYSCINKQAPSYIQELFNFKICNYNLSGSGTFLMIPNFNLEWCHRSFSFLAAKLRNSLPPYFRTAKDILLFKRLLNKHVF